MVSEAGYAATASGSAAVVLNQASVIGIAVASVVLLVVLLAAIVYLVSDVCFREFCPSFVLCESLVRIECLSDLILHRVFRYHALCRHNHMSDLEVSNMCLLCDRKA